MLNTQLKNVARILEEWIEDPSNKRRLIDEPRGDIETDLAGSSLTAARGIASSLDFMSKWHQTSGTVAVLDGDTNGWYDLGRAYREQFLSAELFVRSYNQDIRPRRKKGALVLEHYAIRNAAYGLMFDDQRLCSWLDRDLQARVDEGSIIGKANTPFREFIVTLWHVCCTASLDAVPTDASKLGPYGAVFENWSDQQALRQVLERLCDDHLELSVATCDDDDNEDFQVAPLAVIPIEVHALRTVREKFGLATPKVEHDLTQTPLGVRPPVPSIPHDPLLERVERWMAKNLG